MLQEVILQRSPSCARVGLTLCYGASDDCDTDIFISEIEPGSVADRDGRVRLGDQILQVMTLLFLEAPRLREDEVVNIMQYDFVIRSSLDAVSDATLSAPIYILYRSEMVSFLLSL
uniref:PDZ domain-containing protein n=1 Tax=Steinernema glaseri TaxID=37863 RepID=A0A1I7YYN1_9BILA